MSKDNLILNLKLLSSMLEVNSMCLDEEDSFVFELNYHQKVHFRYNEEIDQLYLFMPIANELPKNENLRKEVCTNLFEESLHLACPEVGRVGFDKEIGSLVFYNRIDMATVDDIYLAMYIPIFIESALDWMQIADQEVLLVRQKEKVMVGVISKEQ